MTDVAAYAIAQSTLGLRDLFVLPVFTRMLGAEGYGIYTQLSVTVTLLAPVVTFRLGTAIVRFLPSERDSAGFWQYCQSGLIWSTCTTLVLAMVLIAFPRAVSEIVFGDSAYSEFVVLGTLLLISTAVSIYARSYLRAVQRVKILAVILLLQSTLEVVLSLVAVHSGYGVGGALWALVVVRAGLSVWMLGPVFRNLGQLALKWGPLREMLAYSIPLMPELALYWVNRHINRIVIAQLLGISSVGVYSAAYSLSVSVKFLLSPIGIVIFPLLSKHWDLEHFDQVRQYFAHVNRFGIYISLPACVGLAAISQPLLRVVATPDFAITELLVFFIAFGVAANGLLQINSYAFYLVRATTQITVILLLGSILNVGLNILLVSSLGVLGSGIGTATAFAVLAVAALIKGGQQIGYGVSFLDIGRAVVASTAMAGLMSWFPMEGLPQVLMAGLSGIVLYVAVVLLTGGVTWLEITNTYRWIVSLAGAD